MYKKKIIVALCLTGLATTTLAVGRQMHVPAVNHLIAPLFSRPSAPLKSEQTPTPSTSAPAASFKPPTQPGPALGQSAQAETVPTSVVYGLLFRELAAFKKKAKDREAKGESADFIRKHQKEKFKLNDSQDRELERIALQADTEARRIDDKARKIIAAIRARNPKGVVRPGERLPTPPTELKTLQEERDQVTLGAREQLRRAFGEAEFKRFDEALRQDVAAKIRPVVSVPQRKAAAPRPESKRQ